MNITSLFGQASPYYSESYDSYYYDSSAPDAATTAAITLFVLGFVFIVALVVYVVSAIFLARIFKKAGVESWKAWVPIYNNWVLLELGEQKGFWAVVALIPVVNIIASVFMYIAMYHVGLKLGKEGAFVLLAIFVPIVWLIWLGVDKSKWQGRKPTLTAE